MNILTLEFMKYYKKLFTNRKIEKWEITLSRRLIWSFLSLDLPGVVDGGQGSATTLGHTCKSCIPCRNVLEKTTKDRKETDMKHNHLHLTQAISDKRFCTLNFKQF